MRKGVSKRARLLPAATGPRARLIGIGLMCAAVFCFTLLDTTAKGLIPHMDTLQVVWGRYASHFLLSTASLAAFTSAAESEPETASEMEMISSTK